MQLRDIAGFVDVSFPQLRSCLRLLQVQLRDIAGFVDTRATILQLKPGTKSHWISFAIAHHLNGSHGIAAEALKKYEGLQVRDDAQHTYIHIIKTADTLRLG